MTDNILEFWRRNEDDPLDALYKTAPIMMHSIGPDNRILSITTFWANALGYSPEDMIGRKVTDFMTEPSRHYAETVVLANFKAIGKIQDIEYEFRRSDGSTMPILMSAVAERDADGKVIRSLTVVFDNTEVKRALALLNQKQRSETIGRLVGGVAHDFNNLLSVIQGSLEFLQEDPDHPEREAYMLDALRATRRGASLTQQLLGYDARAGQNPQKVDLNRVVRDMDAMLSRLLPATIELETITTSGLWKSRIDRYQLDTALLNIGNNARDAMPDGGKITIETANVRIAEQYVIDSGEAIEPGRYVMVALSDTGTGISPDKIDHVFEPFFTTKPVGEGAGMGLSMVQGFVKQSRGFMRLSSEEGYGTNIRMYFPAAGAAGPRDIFVDGAQQPAPTDERSPEILIVEDEDAVRKIVVSQMKSLGYGVSEARSGDIAIAMIAAGYRPKLMITDIIMPGSLQGGTLAQKARALIPDIKVIFMSGHPNAINELDPDSRLQTYDLHLVKPVSKSQMTNAIRDALHDT